MNKIRKKLIHLLGGYTEQEKRERSMISPDYARNFICDFIIGKEQEHTERTLFDL